MFRLNAIYSPDDDGWYAEVWDARTGVTLFTTEVYKTKRLAIRAADAWIENLWKE